MNKVILVGRLTRDPDVRVAKNDMHVVKFTLAVDRRFKKDGEQTADFISCTAFGKTAEHIEKYYHKGTKTIIEGRIQTGNYTNRDGVNVYTTDVVIENTEFAESRSAASGHSNTTQPGASSSSKKSVDDFVGDVGNGDVDDELLPF